MRRRFRDTRDGVPRLTCRAFSYCSPCGKKKHCGLQGKGITIWNMLRHNPDTTSTNPYQSWGSTKGANARGCDRGVDVLQNLKEGSAGQHCRPRHLPRSGSQLLRGRIQITPSCQVVARSAMKNIYDGICQTRQTAS